MVGPYLPQQIAQDASDYFVISVLLSARGADTRVLIAE